MRTLITRFWSTTAQFHHDVRLAEDAGYDGVWVVPTAGPGTHDSVTRLLSAVGTRPARLRIGTDIRGLLRGPIQRHDEPEMLDRMLTSPLDIMIGADDLTLDTHVLDQVQGSGGATIWVSAASHEATQFAVGRGLHVIDVPAASVHDVDDLWQTVRSLAPGLGRDADDVEYCARRHVWVGTDERQREIARREAGGCLLGGTAEQVIEQLADLSIAGATQINVSFRYGALPADIADESASMFSATVLPEIETMVRPFYAIP